MASAHLESVQAIRDLRPALVRFAQEVARALGEADAGVQHVQGLLEGEWPARWARELTRRRDQLSQAKDAWRGKTMFKDSSGRAPSAVDEQEAVERCQRAVAQAEAKLEACRRWRGQLVQAHEQFRAKIRAARDLSPMMTQAALPELDRALAAVEAYLALEGPAGPDATLTGGAS